MSTTSKKEKYPRIFQGSNFELLRNRNPNEGRNQVKTPQHLFTSKHTKTTAEDRFIPLKAGNENYQNFLLRNGCPQPKRNEQTAPLTKEQQGIENYKKVVLNQNFLLNPGGKHIIEDEREYDMFNPDQKMLRFTKPLTDSSTKQKDVLSQVNSYLEKAENANLSIINTPCRFISTESYKMFDAPGIGGNYYLNLIDWGNRNTIAFGIDTDVCIYNNDTQMTSCAFKATEFNDNSGEDNTVTSVSWNNNGAVLAVGCSQGKVFLVDTNKEKTIRTFIGHRNRVSSLAWSEYYLSSAGLDTFIYNRDIRDKNSVESSFEYHKNEVCNIKYNQEGNLLASGGNDNLVCIWDIRRTNNYFRGNNSFNNDGPAPGVYDRYNNPCSILGGHKSCVKALAWCPYKTNLLATGSGIKDKKIRFFDCNTFQLLSSHDAEAQVCSLIWNPKEKEILAGLGYTKNLISVWHYPKMNKMAELNTGHGRNIHLSFSPSGNEIVSGSEDETISFWTINDILDESSFEYQQNISFGMHVR
ncbi:MAG: hypothetical protein MJ252_19135 [archaeon]|nr:hypothetical protein [archaeon]